MGCSFAGSYAPRRKSLAVTGLSGLDVDGALVKLALPRTSVGFCEGAAVESDMSFVANDGERETEEVSRTELEDGYEQADSENVDVGRR